MATVQDPVKAARKRVDALNATHYRLLKEREQVTDAMRENAAELVTAVEQLHEAEQEAAREARASATDLSGAVAPPDPPPTKIVTLGQASDSNRAGARRG